MGLAMNVMPPARNSKRKELTPEERRERRLLRREKQRKDNIGRAAKMHAARLQMKIYEHGNYFCTVITRIAHGRIMPGPALVMSLTGFAPLQTSVAFANG